MLPDFLANWHQDRLCDGKHEWANVRTLKNEFYHPLTANQTILSQDNIPDNLKKYYQSQEAAQDQIFAELNDLVGLQNVKNKIRRIIEGRRYVDEKIRREYFQYNFIFAGNPGTGKTMIANQLGRLAKYFGVIEKGCTIKVDIDKLLGYSNASEKFKEEMDSSLGGVLFIDEAYRLDPIKNPRSDIQQMYDSLMQFMEDHRGEVIVILAGYSQQMQDFKNGNPGMKSRIDDENLIEFEDYSTDELLQIEKMNLDKDKITYHPDFIEASQVIIDNAKEKDPTNFGNARFVRNLIRSSLESKSVRVSEYVKAHNLKSVPEDINILQVQDLPKVHNIKSSLLKPEYQTTNFASSVKSLNQNLAVQNFYQDKQAFYDTYANSLLLLNVTTVDNIKATGTAFIIESSGLALTCGHVVEDAKSIEAVLKVKGRIGGDESYHECRILKMDRDLDIALIQLKGSNFPAMKMASVNYQVKRGEEFVLMGYPLGERTNSDYTTFEGGIASLGQHDRAGDVYLINTEAKHGNSGGPIISKESGEVIGILCGAILSGDKKLADAIIYMRPIRYFWERF